MSNRIRRIFNPTKEEQLEDLERIKEAHEELLQKPKPELVPDSRSNILLVSSPFGTFLEDCSRCLHYVDSNRGFITGGNCRKHNWTPCGSGYTCENWEEAMNFNEWYERTLKNILKE